MALFGRAHITVLRPLSAGDGTRQARSELFSF